MKRRSLFIVFSFFIPSLVAQELLIEGKLRVDSTELDNTADSVVVRQSDGILAVREVSTLSSDGVITRPFDPVHVGSITDTDTTELNGAFSIFVSGKYAYVAANTDNDVEILDVSDPTNPVHIGSSSIAGSNARSIFVSGNYAYAVFNGSDKVSIVDVSDPTDPVEVGFIVDDGTTILDGATSIWVSGKYAYVASEIEDGVEILDISDPANPIHVGAIIDDATTELDGARFITVKGNYAYVAAGNDDGLEILDISDPANPIHVGAITDDAITALDGARSIYLSGKYAYVTSLNDHGVEILDISDPTNPTHVGAITDDATTKLRGVASISVNGNYAYVATSTDNGVTILDVSDPANPVQVGTISDDGTTALDGARSIFVSGQYAYVAASDDDGVEVLEISGNNIHAAQIGALSTTNLDVIDRAIIGKNLYVSGSVQTGHGGIYSQGDLGVLGETSLIGNVGVGTVSPEEALDVAGKIKASGDQIYIRDGNQIISLNTHPSDGYVQLDVGGTGHSTDDIILGDLNAQNNNIGIGTSKPNDALDVVGDIDATGCLQTDDTGAVGGTCLSDRRLKTNIISLDSQLDKLMNLRPVRFQWKEDENLGGLSNAKDMGFIAQEVANVFPEMVVADDEGFQRIRYDVSFQVRMVKALQELGNKNQQLEAENIMLKERLERIESVLFDSLDTSNDH